MSGDGLNQQVIPEIDINENYGIDSYYSNLHIWPQNGEHQMPVGDVTNGSKEWVTLKFTVLM